MCVCMVEESSDCVCMMEESSDYVCVHGGGEFRLCLGMAE